jgi:hypothetical protein
MRLGPLVPAFLHPTGIAVVPCERNMATGSRHAADALPDAHRSGGRCVLDGHWRGAPPVDVHLV